MKLFKFFIKTTRSKQKLSWTPPSKPKHNLSPPAPQTHTSPNNPQCNPAPKNKSTSTSSQQQTPTFSRWTTTERPFKTNSRTVLLMTSTFYHYGKQGGKVYGFSYFFASFRFVFLVACNWRTLENKRKEGFWIWLFCLSQVKWGMR